MSKEFIAVFCVAAATLVSGAPGYDASEYNPVAQACDGVCWYETLKVFPNTDVVRFRECRTQVYKLRDMFLDGGANTPEIFKASFPGGIRGILERLEPAYSQACDALLDSPDATPKPDKSGNLNDGGAIYPFKAFAHCLISTLRQRHGDQAARDVLHEKILKEKDWREAMLERENKFRERHGAAALTIDPELQREAEKWAKHEAEACEEFHSSDEESRWKGDMQGENLATIGGADDELEAAYAAIDGWYEEQKDYPFKTGGYKYDNKALQHKIGHFTQTVWKGSRQVGYGRAYNPNCPQFKSFIAARYFPAGNRNGHGGYEGNVSPVQE